MVCINVSSGSWVCCILGMVLLLNYFDYYYYFFCLFLICEPDLIFFFFFCSVFFKLSVHFSRLLAQPVVVSESHTCFVFVSPSVYIVVLGFTLSHPFFKWHWTHSILILYQFYLTNSCFFLFFYLSIWAFWSLTSAMSFGRTRSDPVRLQLHARRSRHTVLHLWASCWCYIIPRPCHDHGCRLGWMPTLQLQTFESQAMMCCPHAPHRSPSHKSLLAVNELRSLQISVG